jgi:hypothetical protein
MLTLFKFDQMTHIVIGTHIQVECDETTQVTRISIFSNKIKPGSTLVRHTSVGFMLSLYVVIRLLKMAAGETDS